MRFRRADCTWTTMPPPGTTWPSSKPRIVPPGVDARKGVSVGNERDREERNACGCVPCSTVAPHGYFRPTASQRSRPSQNGHIGQAIPAHLDTATVRKRMGVVALAVHSQLGTASPSAGDSRRYNGGSIKMHPIPVG